MKKLAYVGIDVDDKAYHLGVIDEKGFTIKELALRPDPKKLAKELKKKFPDYDIRCCYEAGHSGYSLYRNLNDGGIECRVIVPTSIPRSPNQRIKNDRIDALRLADLYARGCLEFVRVPSVQQQSDRSLVRSRAKIVEQRADLKRHILGVCRDAGLDYKLETRATCHWTNAHLRWLDKTVQSLGADHMCLRLNLAHLLSMLEMFNQTIRSFDEKIVSLSKQENYIKKVAALTCFKGIEVTTAMTILTELFDVRRFGHPKQLVGYLGLDIREHSSGGKQNQFGVSKMGNRRLRTALTESCQKFGTSSSPSQKIKRRRDNQDPEIIAIAERAQLRLYKKGHRLLAREKPRNKVKTACTRELVGFIWEALMKVA